MEWTLPPSSAPKPFKSDDAERAEWALSIHCVGAELHAVGTALMQISAFDLEDVEKLHAIVGACNTRLEHLIERAPQ